VQLAECLTYENKRGEKKWRVTFGLCDNGTLARALKDPNRHLIWDEKKNIFSALIRKVAFLHRRGYLHRQLRLENILLHRGMVERSRKSVIGSFRAACRTDDEEHRACHLTAWEAVSPPYARVLLKHQRERDALAAEGKGFSSPELVDVNTEQLDSWSLALILFRLLDIRDPFWDEMKELVEGNRDEKQKEALYLARLSGHTGPCFAEPLDKNSPRHLVWEMMQQGLRATEAEKRLRQIKWS
jgi:serine/threonine protein kinase